MFHHILIVLLHYLVNSGMQMKICEDLTKLQLITKRFHFFPDTVYKEYAH